MYQQLLLQLQHKEQTITSLKADNDNLSSALHTAETRLGELYADQSRVEEEMAARIEVIEKLRNQTRELEKEKRDAQRRYNEQACCVTRLAIPAHSHTTRLLRSRRSGKRFTIMNSISSHVSSRYLKRVNRLLYRFLRRPRLFP